MQRTAKELRAELLGLTITRDRLKRDKRQSRAIEAEIRDIKSILSDRKSNAKAA